MSEGEERARKIERVRQALGDYSNGITYVSALPDGRMRVVEADEEGTTTTEALWFDPMAEAEQEAQGDDGNP